MLKPLVALNQSSEVISTVYWFCLEFKMKAMLGMQGCVCTNGYEYN
jgi:hypothetical protein